MRPGATMRSMIARAFPVLMLLAANTSAQMPGPPTSRSPGSSQPTTVVGVVSQMNGRPLVGTEVRLVVADSLVDSTWTDGDGRFATKGVLSSKPRLRIRHDGFVPREVELFFPRDSLRVLAVELEPALNTAAGAADDSVAASTWLREFHERRRSSSLGHFYTRREILERQSSFLSEALRSTPGLTITASRTGPGFIIRARGCRYGPVIWVDRGRVADTELDEVVRVDEVAAVEVYTSAAGVPAQYMDRSNVGCGTLIVWSLQ
jgi:hypothetical protein